METQRPDSEKPLDELYEELAEAMRAAGVATGHPGGILPVEEPSDDLEDRILEAALQEQQPSASFFRKTVRGIAWLGSHAMRPQLAMAAVFVMVVGSSLLLLRAKPGTGSSPVVVTQRGTPEAEQEAPGEGLARETGDRQSLEADERMPQMAAADEGPADEAEAAEEDSDADDALALKEDQGCDAALGGMSQDGESSPDASAAMWEAAQCHKAAGNQLKAKELFLALRADEAYRDKATAELKAAEGQEALAGAATGAGGVAAAKKAPAPAAPAADAAAAPAAPAGPAAAEMADDPFDADSSSTGGGIGEPVAAPQRSLRSGF